MHVRFLHIEDSPQDAWLLKRTLTQDGWTVDSTVVASLADLLNEIEHPWDVVLADFGLPGLSTAQALGLVRDRRPGLPFVVVSGQIGEENAVALMKAGADDYVSKHYLQRLSPILHRVLESRRIQVHQQEQELRQQELENRFRQFFHKNLSGMAMVAFDGEIREINQSLAQLMLLDPHHLPNFWSLFADATQAVEVQLQLEGGTSFGPEVVEMRRPDGVRAFLLSTYQLPGGESLIWANFIDHTEQRKLQEQIFQNRRLESLGQLAGGVAHEFNNILAIFQGHLSLLERELPPGPMVPRLEVLKRTGQRGAAIVKQLLALARRAPVQEKKLSVPALLTETEGLVSGLFPENLTIRTVVESNLPAIHGDPDQLGQALLNLLINARDAMPQGGTIALRAGLATTPPRVPWIRIEVADEGPGVPADLMDKIFDPFFTTKGEGKGTGLGLSMVAGVAQAHHGRVGIEANLPHGSVFFLLLPVGDSVLAVSDAELAAVPRPQPGTHILVVENEADLATFERQVLEQEGYEVTVCPDGEQAWSLLQGHPQRFQVVLTDLGMPGLGGEALCALVLSLESPPRLVVQSGNVTPETYRKLLAAGVAKFLIKPFTYEELTTCIAGALVQETPP